MKEVFSRKRGTSMIERQNLYYLKIMKRMKYWFYTISQGYESSVRFPLLLHEESLTENEANRKEWTKGESSVMLIEVLSQVIPEAYCLFLSVIIEKLCIYNLHIYTLYKWLCLVLRF